MIASWRINCIVILKGRFSLKFEHLKDVAMANIWRIIAPYHAMGVIACNVEYIFVYWCDTQSKEVATQLRFD